MADIPVEIRNIIKKFLENLTQNEISLQKAFLFGSYAKNRANEFSDIDIALISSNFSGNPLLDGDLIRKAKLSAGYQIEAHTFTNDEFDESDPFIKEILSYGIPLV